jgi:sulfatase maturation enzyme AslB (radical SAM superfamily)
MKLLQAFLDIHSSCNYNCLYCYRGVLNAAERPTGAMPVETFRRIVPIVKKLCWNISLSCAGEPLLHPDLEGIFDVVNKELSALDVSIVTNGFLLNERARSVLAHSVLSRLSVSVDTIRPDVYARLCGCAPGALDTVLKNVAAFVESKRKGGGSFPKVFVTAIAMKSTLVDLPDLARRFCGIGVDGIKIQWLVPWNESLIAEKIEHDSTTTAVLGEVSSILSKAHVYFEYPNAPAVDKISSMLFGMQAWKNKFGYGLFSLAKIVNAARGTPCRLAGTYLSINKNGLMYACASDAGPPVSFLDNSVDEQERRIRNAIAFLQKNGKYSECEECRFFRK